MIPKIALCFLVRDKPHNRNLWEPFINDRRFNIYIHSSFEQNNEWSKYYIEERVPTTWSNCMLAQKTLLERACDSDIANYKFVVLSESCIPIQSPDFVYNTLIEDNQSYVPHVPAWFGPEISSRYLTSIPRENFFIGSQFFIINRDICLLLKEDNDVIHKVAKYMIDCEQYIATYLSLRGKLGSVTNKELTFLDWGRTTNGGASPYLFPASLDDYDRNALKTAQQNGKLFARKFPDGVDVGFLNQ